MMQHRFCGVFKHKNQMYIERHTYANGPRCAVFPPKPLYRGLALEGFAQELVSALNDYTSLGRTIRPDEWHERNARLLEFVGEKSIAAYERKKKEIGVRYDVASGTYVLLDGKTGGLIAETTSVLDAAREIYDRIGGPATEPPEEGELIA